MTEPILKIKDVSRVYRDEDSENETQALSNVSFQVNRGEFVSLIGASGCGKTTLLRMLAGLDPVETGEITLEDQPIKGTDPKRGYVFQQGSLFPWLTIEQNIAYGLKARGVYKEKKGQIKELIAMTGLTGFEKAYPHQISGGMAQRTAIARSLINEPEILLLDEPMGALDSFTRAALQDKLLELKEKNNTTMILVTHDVDEAIYLSDRIVIMTPRPGRISQIVDVKISRPRNRGGSDFMDIRNQLLKKFELASNTVQPEYMI